jgi:hypothetical protein
MKNLHDSERNSRKRRPLAIAGGLAAILIYLNGFLRRNV